MATLPTPGGSNNTWGTELNAFLQVAHNAGGTLLGSLPVFNVKDDAYGAAHCNGVNDDIIPINAAIAAASAAGGGFVVLPGLCAISGQVALNNQYVYLVGIGPGAGLKPTAGFSGAGKIINITADYCGVRDLTIYGGSSTTIASNPANDAIRCSKRWARLINLNFFYINGWCMNILAGPSTNCAGVMADQIYMEHVLNGIHSLSADANFTGQQFFSNVHGERIEGGDGISLEDVSDVFLSNVMCACTQATGVGNPLHIKGHCQTIKGSAVEPGMFSGNPSSSCILIESGANGSPSDVSLYAGEALDGQIGVEITAGKQITISGFKIGSNNTDGVRVSGSATSVMFDGCVFVANGQVTGGNRYSINHTSTGVLAVRNCMFEDNIGTSSGQVDSLMASSNGTVSFTGNTFLGTGLSAGNLNAYAISGGTINAGKTPPLLLAYGDLTVGSANTLTANTAYFIGVRVEEFVVLTTVYARFTTGGNGYYDIGVYTDNAGVPGTRIDHAAATNTTLATVGSTTVGPAFINGNMLLPPGNYWLAFWINNATDTVFRQAGSVPPSGPVRSLSSSGPLPTSGAGATSSQTKVQLAGIVSGGWS